MSDLRKLPRTIRMDASDVNVFDTAAEPGEWAVTGSFRFVDADPATMDRKAKLAFASGWLGVDSFGWSTLVQVAHADAAAAEGAVRAVAAHLFRDFGAPDMMAAVEAAREVVDEAAALCAGQDAGTLLSIQRDADARGMAERVRVVRRTEGMHAPVWSIADE
jgi:hypothetical protein